MKYNEKYGRYFTNGGLVFRYNSKQDKLVLCKQHANKKGYMYCSDSNGKLFPVHRAIYETFVGFLSNGYEIDHINTTRDDNRPENLKAVTHADNTRNPLTRQHLSETRIKTTTSEFGIKYFEHYGYSKRDNIKQYERELIWFKRHGKCKWE